LTNILNAKTVNVQCDNVEPISFGGLTLPTLHLASINRITALCIFRILNLYSEQKIFTNCYTLLPLHYK